MLKELQKYNKAVVAIVGAIVTWLVSNYAGNADVQHWLGLVLAVLTAAGVYQTPNKGTN